MRVATPSAFGGSVWRPPSSVASFFVGRSPTAFAPPPGTNPSADPPDGEAPHSLRSLGPGPAGRPTPNAELRAAASGKRLIVLDYDGTLADLAVDWDALRGDLSRRARDFGVVSTFRPLWPQMALVRAARSAEAMAALVAVLAEHERQAVVRQQPRPEMVAFARLLAQGAILAVFSANLHATVAAGLDALGLRTLISCIVGADDVTQWKPAPEGLLRAMRLTGCTPADTLFIGDSAGDAMAAHAAGVDFFRV